LGGVESLAELPEKMTNRVRAFHLSYGLVAGLPSSVQTHHSASEKCCSLGISADHVRLSVGTEADNLAEDVGHALE
jgi:cystathionine beta-lyase/cystathionine gamma-synthase